MNQSASNEATVEAIYKEALAKIEEIAARHKKELDDYFAELDRKKIEQLKQDITS